jgi:hypothetical protein
MTQEIKPTGFIVACKEFFGFKPDQTLMGFKEEVAQLTLQDRAELAPMLSKALGKVVSA